ncbi:MAG TPA: cobalamin-dependent protein [Blastocatellia bacterium]|jgi:methanogenic corrinoid protein MtbC1
MADDLNKTVAEAIDAARGSLSEAIVARQYELMPELGRKYGGRGREKCLQDAEYHLSYLAESIATSLPSLFSDYVAWAKIMLAGRGISASDLALNLECILHALDLTLTQEMRSLASTYIEAGMSQLPQLPSDLPAFIREGDPLADLAKQYLGALLSGQRHVASRLILDAVGAGASVKDIYLNVFQRSQYEIGRLWQVNQLSVAQEHYCTAATQLIMSQLYPRIFSTEKNGRTLVAACVGGDLHEIGVRMVSDFFEMEGWDTFYLGANMPLASIVETVIRRKADVIAISATIAYHIRKVADVIAALRANEVARAAKVLVGGYPFNLAPNLWRQLGADGYAGDAEEAIAVANRLVAVGGLP